jgi:hypothetical protein
MKEKLSTLWRQPLTGYTDETHAAKVLAHHRGRRALTQLAKHHLMLPTGEYSIRTNMAGPAVSGEVTLHSHTLYLQISQSCIGSGACVMYRRCNGMKDYSGGSNNFCAIDRLDYLSDFAMHLRGLATFGFVLPDEMLRPGDHNGLSLAGCA